MLGLRHFFGGAVNLRHSHKQKEFAQEETVYKHCIVMGGGEGSLKEVSCLVSCLSLLSLVLMFCVLCFVCFFLLFHEGSW